MKFSFVDFVIEKFEAEADAHDKFKVNLLAGINVAWLTGVSTLGIVTLFNIKTSSPFSYLILFLMSLFFLRPVKFWHISRYLNEIEEGDMPKNETQDHKKK